jgi:anti-anti-sigma regulatory factor
VIVTAIATRSTGSTTVISVTAPVTEADTAHLRTLLVTAIWHERPERVLIDVGSGADLDATVVGALLAAAGIAEDQHVELGVRCADPALADQLAAAGIRAAGLPAAGDSSGTR